MSPLATIIQKISPGYTAFDRIIKKNVFPQLGNKEIHALIVTDTHNTLIEKELMLTINKDGIIYNIH